MAEISFELVRWQPHELLELTEALTAAGIGHRLDGAELTVEQEDADRVDEIIDLVSHPGDLGDPGEAIGGDDDGDDEVGYELEGWTEDQLAQLRQALSDRGIGHSWDDDGTLVVAAGDEHTVDALVAEVEGTMEEALAELVGPTKAVIGDLRVLETPEFIDPATIVLAGHPPVEVRELLQALLYRSDDATPAAVAGQARQLLALLPSPAMPGDDHEELVYELIEWSPELRQELALVLEGEGIPYEWDGDDLAVPAAHEEAVDALIDQMEQADPLAAAPEAADDEANYEIVSDLFVAADRLSNDPKDLALCGDLVAAAERLTADPPGFGIDPDVWHGIFTHAAALVEAIEAEEPDKVVGERAGKLRNALRGFV